MNRKTTLFLLSIGTGCVAPTNAEATSDDVGDTTGTPTTGESEESEESDGSGTADDTSDTSTDTTGAVADLPSVGDACCVCMEGQPPFAPVECSPLTTLVECASSGGVPVIGICSFESADVLLCPADECAFGTVCCTCGSPPECWPWNGSDTCEDLGRMLGEQTEYCSLEDGVPMDCYAQCG
jgi:hypothetical protein